MLRPVFSTIGLSELGNMRAGSDETHLWSVRFQLSDSLLDRLHAVLNSNEREKASRCRFETDRRQSIISRGVLRVLLSRYTDVPANGVEIDYLLQGKPYLIGDSVYFNVAHSKDRLLVAIASKGPLGVDIEFAAPLPDMDAIATRFFSTAEVTALHQLPASIRLEGFYNCWTRKEAYLKALGSGLLAPLNAFAVSIEPGRPAKMLSIAGDAGPASDWLLVHLEPAPDYVGALAMHNGCSTFHCRELVLDDIAEL